jgi:hypothetical protein
LKIWELGAGNVDTVFDFPPETQNIPENAITNSNREVGKSVYFIYL